MNYHDALAKLGVGIAHPGGFATTKQWAGQIPWERVRDVVEIGCGTGRTACYLASQYNIRIAGYDSLRLMIEKASMRASKQGLNKRVKFFVADAHTLPVQDQSVDLVYLESVAVFVQPDMLFSEVYRILRPGGTIVDVEMMSLSTMPKAVLKEIQRFYGARQVPALQEWRNLLKKAGFVHVQSLLTAAVEPRQSGEVPAFEEFDPDQMVTVQPQEMQDIQQILQVNAELLQKTAPYLAYTVLTAGTPSMGKTKVD